MPKSNTQLPTPMFWIVIDVRDGSIDGFYAYDDSPEGWAHINRCRDRWAETLGHDDVVVAAVHGRGQRLGPCSLPQRKPKP